jgi:hypothetical protein
LFDTLEALLIATDSEDLRRAHAECESDSGHAESASDAVDEEGLARKKADLLESAVGRSGITETSGGEGRDSRRENDDLRVGREEVLREGTDRIGREGFLRRFSHAKVTSKACRRTEVGTTTTTLVTGAIAEEGIDVDAVAFLDIEDVFADFFDDASGVESEDGREFLQREAVVVHGAVDDILRVGDEAGSYDFDENVARVGDGRLGSCTDLERLANFDETSNLHFG